MGLGLIVISVWQGARLNHCSCVFVLPLPLENMALCYTKRVCFALETELRVQNILIRRNQSEIHRLTTSLGDDFSNTDILNKHF